MIKDMSSLDEASSHFMVQVCTRLEKQTIGDSRATVIKNKTKNKHFNHTAHLRHVVVWTWEHADNSNTKRTWHQLLLFKMWHIFATFDVIVSDHINWQLHKLSQYRYCTIHVGANGCYITLQLFKFHGGVPVKRYSFYRSEFQSENQTVWHMETWWAQETCKQNIFLCCFMEHI